MVIKHHQADRDPAHHDESFPREAIKRQSSGNQEAIKRQSRAHHESFPRPVRVQAVTTWREHEAVLPQSPQILRHANLGGILGRDPHLWGKERWGAVVSACMHGWPIDSRA